MRTVFLSPGFPALLDVEEQFRVYHNTPWPGYIYWQNLHIVYRGATYLITDGYTDKKFVWWDYDYPYVLQASDVFPDWMTEDDVLVFLNKNGTAVTVPKATIVDGDLIVPGSILTDHLSANCVTSEKILASAVLSTHIAADAIGAAHIAAGAIATEHIAAEGLDAGVIKTGTLDAMRVDVVGKDRMVRLVGDGMVVYDKEGGEAARLGYYEILGDQVASFSRNSAAYTSDGRQAAANEARFEWARLPYPVWQDTFDTNRLATEYVSGGDVPATWSVSGGVLTGTGGTQALLLKKYLYLQDCEIVVNSDQAHDGGVVARYQDNNNYYLLALRDDSGGAPSDNLQIYKRVAGSYTSLGSADVSWSRGTSKQVKFVLRGSVLEAYFDGIRVISITDTTFSGGAVGLRNHASTAFRVLDWAVHYVARGGVVEEGTTNLLTANQSSVETDLTGLEFVHCTGTRDTTTAWHGTASAKATVNSGATSARMSVWPQRPSVSVGTTYTFSIYLKSLANSNAKVEISLAFYDANGAQVGSANNSGRFSAPRTWQRFSISGTAPTGAVTANCIVFFFDVVGGDVFWWDGAQLEAKPYATTWTLGGTTRAAEVMTAPTAGVFKKGSWTVKLRFNPQSSMNVGTTIKYLWQICIDNDNRWQLFVGWYGELALMVRSGGTEYWVVSSTGYVVPGNDYYISASGDGAKLRLFCNGAQIGSDTTYTEPSGTLPAGMGIGYSIPWSGQANGIISDFAVLNKAQTLAEHRAEYQSGRPLKVDDHTTLLMSMSGTLKPTVRRLGLSMHRGVVEAGALIVDKFADVLVDAAAGFGDGSDGVFFSTGNVTFTVPQEDASLLVKQYRSFTLNTGHTLTVDKRCRGLVILVRGDVVINGTINLDGKSAKLALEASSQLSLVVKGRIFQIPPGGSGGNGGAGGAGGGATAGGGAGASGTLGLWSGGGWGGAGGGGSGGTARYSGGAAGASTLYLPVGSGGAGGGIDAPGGSGGNLCGGGGSGGRYSGDGGGGGGAGYYGGGGGAGYQYGATGGSATASGGGTLVIVAKGNLTIGSTGAIYCRGSNGAAGGNGGSAQYDYNGAGGGGGGQGGGGGGVVVFIVGGTYSNSGTVNVNGGSGGAGGARGGYGAIAQPGVSGQGGSVGRIEVHQV